MVRVAKEGHPEVVIWEAGKKVGFVLELHAALIDGPERGLDVADEVVNDRGGMIELGLVRRLSIRRTPPQSKKAAVGISKRNFIPSVSR